MALFKTKRFLYCKNWAFRNFCVSTVNYFNNTSRCTFCCGKKRSDESMATLVELNSEPAVEELSKQILSEAKLWEAIQEARAELQRRREEQQNMIPRDRPLALTMTGLRRKRSSEGQESKSLIKNKLEAEHRRR